jgi:recombination associated protein RdgC
MFFKNLLAYRLTQPLTVDAEGLQTALATKPAREPGTQELSTYGFIAPYGKGEESPLVYERNGYILIATRKATRQLPATVIREAVVKKVEAIEFEQQRKVYKKERDQLKDEIIQALMPHAFVRNSHTLAAIDLKAGLILVNTSSANTAEDLLSTLREVIGTLPVRPLTVKVSPAASMTEWVKTEEAPTDIYVLDSALLRDTHEDGGTITARGQDLTSDEIKLHLSTGKVVTQLALAYADKLSFVLDDKMVIRRLRFESILKDQADADGGDDADGQFASSFVLMMLTLNAFFGALVEALGGEEVPQGI